MTGGICGLARSAKLLWKGGVPGQAPTDEVQQVLRYLVCKVGGAFPGAAWDDRTTEAG